MKFVKIENEIFNANSIKTIRLNSNQVIVQTVGENEISSYIKFPSKDLAAAEFNRVWEELQEREA